MSALQVAREEREKVINARPVAPASVLASAVVDYARLFERAGDLRADGERHVERAGPVGRVHQHQLGVVRPPLESVAVLVRFRKGR